MAETKILNVHERLAHGVWNATRLHRCVDANRREWDLVTLPVLEKRTHRKTIIDDHDGVRYLGTCEVRNFEIDLLALDVDRLADSTDRAVDNGIRVGGRPDDGHPGGWLGDHRCHVVVAIA